MRLRATCTKLGTCLLASSLTGCAVYVPMQAAAPDLRDRGEVEVAANWSLTNRLEVAGAYSPARHLLVRAAGSTKSSQPANDTASFINSRQYELGVGTYWLVGRRLLAGGLLGFGQAHTEARYEHDYPLFISPYSQQKNFQFDARYLKYSGEAFITWQPGQATSLGLAYRLVQLRLNDVTDQGVPVTAAPILRHEPMLYFRLRPPRANGLVQFQVAAGLSTTAGFNDRLPYDHDDPVAQFRVARSYVALGLAFYPHVLWQRRGD